MESEFTGLPRYVIAFLYQMAHYPEYLRWNVTEGSHKITLTLTWNFSCPAASAKRQTPLLLKTGLWDRLQRTLRRPDGSSVPPEISTFLQRTAGEMSAETAAPGDHAAGRSAYGASSSSSSSSKSRKLSDALKEFRSRRRMRSSLSLPDRIMEPPTAAGVAAVSTPGDESRTPSERRTAISYPTTPVRSPNVNGGCPSAAAAADALLLLRPGSKTVSWPRLGDLLYVAAAADSTGRVARPAVTAGKAWDHPPNETAKARPKADHSMIFVQRASPDVASSSSSFSRTDRELGGLSGPCPREEGSSRQRHASLGQATIANPALNQTVRKCLDSCDKILFRHSTTIT